MSKNLSLEQYQVSTHSRPKAAVAFQLHHLDRQAVSTHSRPKAAALCSMLCVWLYDGFNTQPPEGGCSSFVV